MKPTQPSVHRAETEISTLAQKENRACWEKDQEAETRM